MRTLLLGLLVCCLIGCSGGEVEQQRKDSDTAEYQLLVKEIKELEDSLKSSEQAINKMAAVEFIAKSEAFASGFSKDPQAAFMLFRAADVARGIGVYDLAIQHWQTVYDNYPEYEFWEEALFMMGYTYENNIGDKAKAKEKYEAFLEKHPTHKRATDVKQILAVIDKSPEDLVREFQKKQKEEQQN
ncbi:MAG: tetratricopeptide repeat protein [Bacteroidota bacterium]